MKTDSRRDARRGRMAGRLAVLLLASAVGLCASLWAVPRASASDKPVRYEYVLLIDTSGSMSGLGPGHPHDIFPRVQSEVSRFIGSLDLGNSVVYLYPFSGGLGKASVVSLRTAADKVAAERRVGRLVANGATTAIYDSLGRVLLQLQRVRRAAPGVTHVQTILLFTERARYQHANVPGPDRRPVQARSRREPVSVPQVRHVGHEGRSGVVKGGRRRRVDEPSRLPSGTYVCARPADSARLR